MKHLPRTFQIKDIPEFHILIIPHPCTREPQCFNVIDKIHKTSMPVLKLSSVYLFLPLESFDRSLTGQNSTCSLYSKLHSENKNT